MKNKHQSYPVPLGPRGTIFLLYWINDDLKQGQAFFIIMLDDLS